jgi:maleate isomerase
MVDLGLGSARARAGGASVRAEHHPSELYDWIVTLTADEAGAMLIGGNGFRSAGVIAALDARGDPGVRKGCR